MHIYGIGLDMNINEVMHINETSLPPVPPAPPPSGLPAYWPSSLRVYKDLPLTAVTSRLALQRVNIVY